MKGSDKWGQGSGPRLELVLAVLVGLSLAGVAYYYFVTSGNTSSGQGNGTMVSTTGVSCGDSSLPALARLAEQDSRFLSLSNGRCFNYLGQTTSQGGNLTLTFAHYNGTIAYPCGTSPEMAPESEIQVLVAPAGQVASVQGAPVPPGTTSSSCDRSVPVRILSVTDVESTIPAVPQLNLTLVAANSTRPITSLRAVLTLDGGSQSFQFSSVGPTRPLQSGGSTSMTEIVLSSVSFAANKVYPMVVSGTFENGQTFAQTLHFQIANVPQT